MAYTRMPGPYWNPSTKSYYYRNQLPPHLQEIVGLKEIRKPFRHPDGKRVTDLPTARKLWPIVAAPIEAMLERLTMGQAVFEGGQFRAFMEFLFSRFAHDYAAKVSEPGWLELQRIGLEHSTPENFHHAAKHLLLEQGVNPHHDTIKLVADALPIMAEKVMAVAEDVQANGPYAASLPSLNAEPPLSALPSPLRALPAPAAGVVAPEADDAEYPRFVGLVDGWAAEKKPAQRTHYEFKRAMKRLATYVQHDNPQAVTKADVVGWKNHLIGQGKTAKTVNDNNLAHIKAVFNWAVRNVLLTANPAAGVLVEEGSKKTAKKKTRLPYTLEEAKLILAEARKLPADAPRFPYRKWLVFLMAYQGCRITEAAQLLKADIKKDKDTGVWYLDFNIEELDLSAPADGSTAVVKSLKNAGSIRRVPVHPELIKEGFLEFVEACTTVRLFPDIVPDQFGKAGGNASKWYGRWLRDVVKIEDPRKVAHSWRHLWKDLARGQEISKEIYDAIQGHEEGDTSGEYGLGFPLDVLDRAMRKIPAMG